MKVEHASALASVAEPTGSGRSVCDGTARAASSPGGLQASVERGDRDVRQGQYSARILDHGVYCA